MSVASLITEVAARWPLPRRPRGPLILCYHGIGGVDGVPVELFEAQLDSIRQRRTVVPLADAVEMLGTVDAHSCAAITFDDGYEDYADLAVPALARRDLHATLFVPAGHIGGSNVWDEGFRERRSVMDAQALSALDPAVTEVGAHGYSHCRMRALDDARLEQEVVTARTVVADAVGRTVRLMAYPYGLRDDFDDAARRAVERAGYLGACSAAFGRDNRPGDRFSLRRVTIESDDTLETFERKIDGAFDWYAGKEALGAMRRRLFTTT